jgi:hypothetical protein
MDIAILRMFRAEMQEWIARQEILLSSTRAPTMDTTRPSPCESSPVQDNDLQSNSLAIARIFGGFPKSFYTAYHEHCPKTEPVEEYELRGDLYELFHYLNHTALFGVRNFFCAPFPA